MTITAANQLLLNQFLRYDNTIVNQLFQNFAHLIVIIIWFRFRLHLSCLPLSGRLFLPALCLLLFNCHHRVVNVDLR